MNPPTDIPALIERLRKLHESTVGAQVYAVCATALVEQGKALAAARVAEGEAMLVVEQQDREIARLERHLEGIESQVQHDYPAVTAALRRQLAEARAVVEGLGKLIENDEQMDLELFDRARQLFASTEEQ